MEIQDPLALFCTPAKYFLILIFFDIIYIAFFKEGKKKKTIPINTRIIIFFLLCLSSIGWAFLVNYACGYQKYVAIGFAAIPVLYLTFKNI
jgi:hypothetical protein